MNLSAILGDFVSIGLLAWLAFALIRREQY
jgi:hypothetical protein